MTKPAWTGCASISRAKMKGTPDANLSRCCRRISTMHGLAFRDAAAKIASVDTLQAFMKDFSATSGREELSPLCPTTQELLRALPRQCAAHARGRAS